MTTLQLIAGLVALIVGAELLVRGASRLAGAMGVSSLVIGLTVVAFGTSAPELAVSIKATLDGQSGVALGNVIGSNTFNVLFILGLSATIAPLVVSSQLVRLDVPVMIGVSLLTIALAWDGTLGRLDGAILFSGILVYTGLLLYVSRKQQQSETESTEARPHGLLWSGVIAVVGFALLVVGSRLLVTSAVSIAEHFGVSNLVIGLTIVAAGTSLPEVVTSVVASLRGERDIAVGNVVGSNIFNLLCVLGATALIAPGGIPISPSVLTFDLPVMTAVAVACLPIFFTGMTISRWEGLLLLGYYVAYTTYLILAATKHAAQESFGTAMMWFVIPITGVTLVVMFAREWRGKRKVDE
ncbi:calcium/sodium antiporter [Aeoliella sp.]|uniref:calcium/sodium antiporter n=1 Tax=Aeoliella sp. TaxID=2795800 RepID=UPI003CCBB3F5